MAEFAAMAALLKLGLSGIGAGLLLLTVLVIQNRLAIAKIRDNHLTHIYTRLTEIGEAVARIEGRLNGPK